MVQVEWHRPFYFLIRLIYLHQVQYFVTGHILGRSPWFCDCSLGSPGKCTSYHNAFSALTLLVGWQEGCSSCKNWVVGCWSGYLSRSKCRLAYGPADATHCLFSKIQIDLPFWYRLTWVVPEKRPLNVCMCVCVCVYMSYHNVCLCLANRCHTRWLLRWRNARQTDVSGRKPSRSIQLASRKNWPSTWSWTANANVKGRLRERYFARFNKCAFL